MMRLPLVAAYLNLIDILKQYVNMTQLILNLMIGH